MVIPMQLNNNYKKDAISNKEGECNLKRTKDRKDLRNNTETKQKNIINKILKEKSKDNYKRINKKKSPQKKWRSNSGCVQ